MKSRKSWFILILYHSFTPPISVAATLLNRITETTPWFYLASLAQPKEKCCLVLIGSNLEIKKRKYLKLKCCVNYLVINLTHDIFSKVFSLRLNIVEQRKKVCLKWDFKRYKIMWFIAFNGNKTCNWKYIPEDRLKIFLVCLWSGALKWNRVISPVLIKLTLIVPICLYL